MMIEIFKNIEIEVRYINKTTVIVENLIIDNKVIANSWLEIINFLELFQSYIKNHLSFNITYPFDKLVFKLHKSKRDEILLSMNFEGNIYAFSKLNASKIVHKINRILARCDLLYQ